MFLEVRKELLKKSEKNLGEFSKKLCPGNKEEILGIRIPKLREMAKEIVKQDGFKYLEESKSFKQEKFMEEILLEGLVIAYTKIDIDKKLELIKEFVPKINNWMINDSFCPSLKIKKQDLEKVWVFIMPYLESKQEFEVRFGVIMMFDYFIIDEYVDKVIENVDKIQNTKYYAEMAIAWLVAEIGIKYNDKAMKYLKGKNNLSKFSYNKALQKMRESYRIPKEQKEELQKMKRK